MSSKAKLPGFREYFFESLYHLSLFAFGAICTENDLSDLCLGVVQVGKLVQHRMKDFLLLSPSNNLDTHSRQVLDSFLQFGDIVVVVDNGQNTLDDKVDSNEEEAELQFDIRPLDKCDAEKGAIEEENNKARNQNDNAKSIDDFIADMFFGGRRSILRVGIIGLGYFSHFLYFTII